MSLIEYMLDAFCSKNVKLFDTLNINEFMKTIPLLHRPICTKFDTVGKK